MNENKKKLFLSTSSGFDWNTIKRWNMSAKNTGHDVCNLLINTNKELVDTDDINNNRRSFLYSRTPITCSPFRPFFVNEETMFS
jgi:hypothetical protein